MKSQKQSLFEMLIISHIDLFHDESEPYINKGIYHM